MKRHGVEHVATQGDWIVEKVELMFQPGHIWVLSKTTRGQEREYTTKRAALAALEREATKHGTDAPTGTSDSRALP